MGIRTGGTAPREGEPPTGILEAKVRGQEEGSDMAALERGYGATKEQLRDRLARIEGQVRGISRMVDEDRYCVDILTQISAIRAALDKVALGLLDDHARHCLVGGRGGPTNPEEQVRELMGAVGRMLQR